MMVICGNMGTHNTTQAMTMDGRESCGDDHTLDNYHNYLVSCQLSRPAIVHN